MLNLKTIIAYDTDDEKEMTISELDHYMNSYVDLYIENNFTEQEWFLMSFEQEIKTIKEIKEKVIDYMLSGKDAIKITDEKTFKEFLKTLDKQKKICYNINVIKRADKLLKTEQRN